MNDIKVETNQVSLADFLGEAPVPEKEKFEVDTSEKADWALQKAGEAQWLIGKYEAERDVLIARIKKVCDEKTKDAYETVEHMAALLDPWARKESESIKKKTIPLVNGSIKIIPGRESVEITKEGDLLKWLNKEHQEALDVKETVSIKKAAVKVILEAGEEVPGAKLVTSRDKIQLQPTFAEITE
jgi:phage host-nuclease inhibitor protein Gam